jgi:uncharacterized protein DUF1580
MIDISTEKPLPLEEATSLIPPARRGKRTHFSTLVRWIKNGVLNPYGERVHLEAIRLGGRWMTSREALQRFAERLTPATDRPLRETPRTPTTRQRRSEEAGRKLERLGI